MQVPGGRVVIELAPDFAPAHVANIRTLAREHYWDGLSIYRSQDNFVVQFGDPTEAVEDRKSIGSAQSKLPAEFTRDSAGLRSEEHTSELQSLMRISYAVFCLKKKKQHTRTKKIQTTK